MYEYYGENSLVSRYCKSLDCNEIFLNEDIMNSFEMEIDREKLYSLINNELSDEIINELTITIE